MANPRRNGPNLAEKNPVFMCRAAPGLRAFEYGTLWYVGSSGYSWASTQAGTEAYYMRFAHNGITAINYNNHRAFGLQLRCLQEEGPGRSRERLRFVALRRCPRV